MANANPFLQAKATKKSVPKGKTVTASQARRLAAMLKGKKPVAMPMDAEDKIDGGVDEKTEKS